jgi:hypothetical protein
MTLTPEELDALLTFLEKEWLPDEVQQAYDKLAAEKAQRETAGARLSDLEHRLREAAAMPRPRMPETDDEVTSHEGHEQPATSEERAGPGGRDSGSGPAED